MRLHFQKNPGDLYLVVGYTAVTAVILLLLKVDNLSAILLVLLVPGYVLVAAFFPGSPESGKPEIDWIERIALSFGLSIAVAPLFGLFLNFSPWGIHFTPMAVTITLFTIGVGVLAHRRRMHLPTERRLSLTLRLGLPVWPDDTVRGKILTWSLAGSIVVASGTLGYVVLTLRPGETFTEFYILGLGGNASGYPMTLNVSQTTTIIVGISNHESTGVTYTVRVDLVGVRLVYNASSGFNETFEVNRTTWSILKATLESSATWTDNYTFAIPSAGLWKVQFLLFKEGGSSSSYRELHLFIRVI